MRQFSVDDQTTKVRRVTFARPPFNLIGADTLAELLDIVDRLSGEEQVSVVIFDSATPGDAPVAAARSTPRPSTCATPAGNRRSSASPRSASVWSPALAAPSD
ncbi:hypothetical protein [Micromonospora haikouensis]|uniref:hypothetical protein n=1 Tax=Micromonospora haikouensis TaxID=686309 RepID=UPI001C405B7F|nr:hypothetical protein [Micromonospora haikouensis]